MGRRGAPTGLSGILAVDKPTGMTSHDVVSRVRRATGERRVGHAGTLDPAATGVLVVLVGPATRLTPYLASAEKEYRARVTFGTATDTDDAEGSVTATAEVPEALRGDAYARQSVAELVGTHAQVPPAYSAVKRGGVPAHRAARAGAPLELAARSVTVSHAALMGIDIGPPVAWDIRMAVSKGTYVRALARDLGEHLGTCAHLSALRRTRSGTITLDDTFTLEQLDRAGPAVAALFTDPVRALDLPVIEVAEDIVPRIAAGSGLDAPGTQDGTVVVASGTHVLGVHRWSPDAQRYRPLVVIPGGVARCA